MFDDIFEMIDADLQPVKPDPNCPDSMRVFENHKKVSQPVRLGCRAALGAVT